MGGLMMDEVPQHVLFVRNDGLVSGMRRGKGAAISAAGSQ
jgi:hypothetical protein